MISVLCALPNSIYKTIPGIDVWDVKRDAYYFTGSNPVIVHPPCPQWSRLKAFANPDPDEKELAYHCLKYVVRNGGIFEHPAGSTFFKEAGISNGRLMSVDQFWWGFTARKRTHLFFSKCRPLSTPLRFDATEWSVGMNRGKGLPEIKKSQRSETTKEFATWLINCILKP